MSNSNRSIPFSSVNLIKSSFIIAGRSIKIAELAGQSQQETNVRQTEIKAKKK